MSDELRHKRRANFTTLLNPRHIAFVGGRHVERCISMCRGTGYAGEIWVVNPKYASLADIPCSPSIEALPSPPDASFIVVSAARSVEVVRSLSAIGAAGAICHASGFAELGGEHVTLQKELESAAGELAVLGPNCMGVINGFDRVAMWGDNGYFEAVDGNGVALISQSGAFLFGVTNVERAYPLGYGISAGNQAVLDIADLIEVVIADPRVRVVGLYVEGLLDGRQLGAALGNALEKEIPVVLLRGGGTQASAERSFSHTGTLAVPNDFWKALVERYALVEVHSPKQLVETTKLLAVSGVLPGPRVFFTTYSGAACTLLAEQAPARGLELPPVSDTNYARIRPTLPDVVTISNPFDLALPWQSDSPVKMEDAESIANCLKEATEGSVDAVVFLQDIPRAGGGRDATWLPAIDAMIQIARETGLATIVSSIFPEGLEPSVRRYALQNGVSPLMGMTECIESLAGSAGYRAALDVVNENPQTIPLLAAGLTPDRPAPLDEWESMQALVHYGVCFPKAWAGRWEEAVLAAEGMGYPVVVKALSEQLPHKSHVGGVHLLLHDADAVLRAIESIRDDVSRAVPGLVVTKVVVEKMVLDGVLELIIGVKRHPALGTALVVGRGGSAVESLRNYALVLIPATDRELHGALSRLGLGLEPGARQNLLKTLRSVEAYALDNLETLSELDVNPVIVRSDTSVVAVDALAVVTRVPPLGGGSVSAGLDLK